MKIKVIGQILETESDNTCMPEHDTLDLRKKLEQLKSKESAETVKEEDIKEDVEEIKAKRTWRTNLIERVLNRLPIIFSTCIVLCVIGLLFYSFKTFTPQNSKPQSTIEVKECGIAILNPQNYSYQIAPVSEESGLSYTRVFVADLGFNAYCFAGEGKKLRNSEIYVLPVENLVIQTNVVPKDTGEKVLKPVKIPTTQKPVFVILNQDNLLQMSINREEDLQYFEFQVA
jgi:hypothetical protein